MVWPAVIAAGASIAGSLLSKNSGLSKGFQMQVLQGQQAREDNLLQRRVADAKAAGLHPLFGLGAAPAGGGSSGFIPGQSTSGSALGEGIAQAGRAVSRGMERKAQEPLVAAQIRAADADAARDLASAAEINSRRKRAESEALTHRLPADGINPMTPLPPATTMTDSNVLHGPFGGVYRMPEGVTPQEEWETRIGEGADWTVGPGIGLRIVQERHNRLKRQSKNLAAAYRQKWRREALENARTKRFSRKRRRFK